MTPIIGYWKTPDILFSAFCPRCEVGEFELYYDPDAGFSMIGSRFCPNVSCGIPVTLPYGRQGPELIIDNALPFGVEHEPEN